MQPDSTLLVILLFGLGTALIVLLVRIGRWLWRVPLIIVAVLACALGGMAVVNDYYGYYSTWGQLYADLSGSYARYTTSAVGHRGFGQALAGQVRSVKLPGAQSGINRDGLVYLPPQYAQPRYASTRFPVLELIHGTPGRPSDFLVHLGLVRLLDHMIATHLMGPMIVVLPQMSTSTDFQECVDGPHGQDDTYITDDVRNDVLAQFRASTEPAEWGIAGYSSGGYCAANLALRHRAMFGAAGVMDGYFRPTDGPAAAALGNDPAAEAANDPITLARGLTSDTKPLPAFWVSAGTGVAADIAGADAFVASLHGVEQVDLVREPGAGHNFYAWRPALPRVLAWMWTQLAPPYLRVQFPIAGGVHGSVVPARPAPGVSRQADRRQHA